MSGATRGQRPMRIPTRLAAGDVIAVVSPAWGAVGALPHRAERASQYLERLGLTVRFMSSSRRNDGWSSASPEERADDINCAFGDRDIAAILCSIGGNHTNQVLPHLDWDVIAANPKLFQGYSDITVLHWALAKNAGLRTFYGPALISELAEWPVPLPFTDASLTSAWFGAEPLTLEAAREWTEERIEWETDDIDSPRARVMAANDNWHWLRPGRAEGWLFGGCLETICWHLKGQADWLDLEGCVLFLETSEEAPSPAHIDAYLTDLEQLDIFNKVTGLILGRPAGYTPADVRAFEDVIVMRTANSDIPVVANLDCGHTDPMLTLPFGTGVSLDSAINSINCQEAATKAR
ncbi:MAG: LD-carboxypeptidase [Candidatus Dormibacteraeota bacterium]|uniref:LD-carboxypeptidase n=1 Tax=Candidatus Amunia macphersoniae TaxID=3127014 RepID=A0A934NFG1_9BACT|nr:LD-carboxypeptidase [Candidatus Dormibacteraeota bacterium]